MEQRYLNPDVRIFNKSSFLDPRFKSLAHLTSLTQEEVMEDLVRDMMSLKDREEESREEGDDDILQSN